MAKPKPWKDKDFMVQHYTKGRKSINQIAEICEGMGCPVTAMTIYNALIDLKIPIRGGNRNLGPRSVGGDPSKKGKKGFY